MFRGTTPQLEVIVTGVDFAEVAELWLTIGQNGRPIVNKDLEDLTIEDNTIYITFTQEDTLALRACSSTYLQLRVLMNDGTAIATPVKKLNVNEIIKDGIIGETNEG